METANMSEHFISY